MANTPDKNPDTGRRSEERRREISGPGAADFLTAPGGMDRPETDPEKGTSAARAEAGSPAGPAPEGLAPSLDAPEGRAERQWESDLPHGPDQAQGGGAQEQGRRRKGENPP